uniref:Uncharacterized protein n=1 Tax=Schizopora paradoxa TaxID=27342 RepID=A0A5B9RKN8_9AGAM|nr:hypothetical protein Schpa_000062 [Schizopora paradoxa]QEG57217.1 hypothetical protein Schpa_000062 [Schizopora paradoxa]
MFIFLDQMKQFIVLINSDHIPMINQLALYNFILCSFLLLSFINILIYFMVITFFNNDKFVNKIKEYKLLNKIFTLYKNTRIYFLIYEIIFFLFVNVFILWQSYRLFSIYL